MILNALSRRQLLVVVGTTTIPVSAGCIFGDNCDKNHSVIIKTEPVEEPDWEYAERPLIQYSSLTDDEKEILDTAIEEGEYRRCVEERPTAAEQRFTDRVSDVSKEARCYLEQDGEYYALGVRIEDGFYTFLPRDGDVTSTSSS